MLPRIVPTTRALIAASRFNGAPAVVRCMSGHHPSLQEVVTQQRSSLNDMPVPQGSWQEDYNKKNATWNLYLGLSTASLLATIFVGYKLEILMLNPPPDFKKVNVSSR